MKCRETLIFLSQHLTWKSPFPVPGIVCSELQVHLEGTSGTGLPMGREGVEMETVGQLEGSSSPFLKNISQRLHCFVY